MKSTLTTLLAICLCLPLMGDDAAKKKFLGETKTKAEKGDAKAQHLLGGIYESGSRVVSVKQDIKEAVKWYRKAAEQGYIDAQMKLGLWYGLGQGVPEDYVTAYAWSNIAQLNGSGAARKIKSEFLRNQMTPEQIVKAQELSKEMVKKNPKLLKD